MSTNPPVQTGALSSPHDYRDAYAAASATAGLSGIQLPATHRSDVGPVLMQAQEPACVSHSVVELMKLYFFLKTGVWVDLSARFLDILSAEAWIPLDGGRVPRTVLKLAVTVGCCTTATLANDTSLPIGQYRNPNVITAAMRAEALKYRIPGFIAVPLDLQSTRAAILLYGAVSTLMQIGSEWWLPSWADRDIDPLRTPKTVVSGHQITPVGWTTSVLNILRNHWSALWANNGEAQYDHGAWSPYIVEQWAIADIPSDVASFLKTLPSPSAFHFQWNADMAIGDYGDDVRFAQVALMILGFLPALTPDAFGHYGPLTASAVSKYQQANRISPVPTHIGPQTRAALNRQFAI